METEIDMEHAPPQTSTPLFLFGARQRRSLSTRKPWSDSQHYQKASLIYCFSDKPQEQDIKGSPNAPNDNLGNFNHNSDVGNASVLRESADPYNHPLMMEVDNEVRIFQRRKKQKSGPSPSDSGTDINKSDSNTNTNELGHTMAKKVVSAKKHLPGGKQSKPLSKVGNGAGSNGFPTTPKYNDESPVQHRGKVPKDSTLKGVGRGGSKGNESNAHSNGKKKSHLLKGTTQSSEKVCSTQKTGKWRRLSQGTTPSRKLCTPESRKQKQSLLLQDMSEDEDMGSNIDQKRAFNGSNAQTSPESEGGIGMLRTSDASDGGSPQLQTLRKSARVPKKRIFDGDEDEVLEYKKRQKKKIDQDENQYDYDIQANDADSDQKGDPFVGQDLDEKGLPLTARQRALKINKEGGDLENSTSVEFPDGLSLPKRQKETLSEAEQAIKKEEAARRRKQQMEKNAKQIQANAIQKILGQESSRKKREEKLLKQRQEIEQEKQAAQNAPAVNSIRWVMGPSGNIVSFSEDVELSKFFPGPCSYPQEREKCAGPSCNNAYKYRDSKTRLPLCSLQCYKAVQATPSFTPAF